MSVPVGLRKKSATEFEKIAWELKQHIFFYCTGKRFGRGNAANRKANGEKIYQEDLIHIRNITFSIFTNVSRANHMNVNEKYEYLERRKLFHFVLADLDSLDMCLQDLIDKFVTFDSETDKVKKAIPNAYFYEKCAELMSKEEELIKGILASDSTRFKAAEKGVK